MTLELNSDIFRAVLESLPAAVYFTDGKNKIAFWNSSAVRITGYLSHEVIGRFCPEAFLKYCDENQAALSDYPLAQTTQDGRPRDVNIFLRHKEGQRVPVRVRSTPVRDEFGVMVGAVECFEERSFRTIETRSGRFQAELSLDEVTEIADGESTQAGLEAALAAFAASGVPFGVLSIAIDNLDHLRHISGFQAVNDLTYAVAQTLSRGTRPGDLVGLWREDRFAAFVECPAADGLRNCAERLKRLVSLTSVPWWGDQVSASVCMGGTIVRAGDTAESLLERAEEALKAATAAQTDSILVV